MLRRSFPLCTCVIRYVKGSRRWQKAICGNDVPAPGRIQVSPLQLVESQKGPPSSQGEKGERGAASLGGQGRRSGERQLRR